MLSIRTILVAVMIILIAAPGTNFAQDVATCQAIANVLASLAIQAVQDLDFGDCLQGVAKTVPNDDAANSGIFVITGEPGAGISVYITLPAYLATAAGDDRLNIGFGVTDASIDSSGNVNPATFGDGWQDVNPFNIPTGLTIGSAGPNQTAIFLGGRVTPAVNQLAGPYSGNITVTVAYTGT